jgi:predicted membrane protein
MKMGIGLFWGIILIAIGLSIIFKVIFDVSIFRILIAIVFILIGIKILVGRSVVDISTKDSDVIFNDKKYTEFPLTSTEYNTIFGKSVYDFSDAKVPTDTNISLQFNTVFGQCDIILPEGLPVRIKADAVFGAVKLPNENSAVFGSANYQTEQDSVATNFVNIKASAVFGNIEIKKTGQY